MLTVIKYLLLFHLALSMYGDEMKLSDIKIPSEYVSEPAFIEMLFQNPTPTKTLYASPSGSGSTCSSSSPCSLSKAVGKLQKGYKLYLKGGSYNVKSGISITASGTESQYIVISSAPNEVAKITSSSKGEIGLFSVEGSYIIIENLTFEKVKAKEAKGIVLSDGGQHHVIIRNNDFNNLNTTKINEDYGANAILLIGENEKGIKKVIAYRNTIHQNYLGYSEALSVAGNCEEIYVLNNVVKSNTNIGIDFYGNAKYCRKASLDQPRKSVAMYNYIEKSVSPYAECAGLYVDGSRDILLQYNKIVKSQYGIEVGAEEKVNSYPVKNIIVKDNIIEGSTETGLRIGGYDEKDSGLVKNATFSGNTITGSTYGAIISKAENILIEGNRFEGMNDYFIDMEFTSSYTKKVEVKNNKFKGKGKFRVYKTTTYSLDNFIKKYPTNEKIQ